MDELVKGDGLSLKDFESWEEARQIMQSELADARRARDELETKLQQSQGEVEKLSRRNAEMTAQLQNLDLHLDDVPREEIKARYQAALDALQRLVVMRSQIEKLEAQSAAMQRYIELLEAVEQIMNMGMSNEPGSAGSFATVEMMIRAQESERQRLSRQMHDGPAQALANFILQVEIAARYFDVDPDKAREELQVLKTAAAETFQQVRDFIFTLRPMMLDDLGAIPTVRRYVDAIKNQTDVDIEVVVTGQERRLESYLEVIIFRSIQELLGNAISDGHATEVRIQIDLSDHEVRVSVEDNGKGYDPDAFESSEFVGVRLIRERTELLGGFFEVDSAVGQGTRIAFRIPVGQPDEAAV